MTIYNLSLLPASERRSIELQRQAALLIHNLNRGSITRLKVETEILKLDESEREKFKGFLNFFKSNKVKSKVKRKTNTNDGSAKAKEWLNNIRGQLNNGE